MQRIQQFRIKEDLCAGHVLNVREMKNKYNLLAEHFERNYTNSKT
jgi:hypothetical protein